MVNSVPTNSDIVLQLMKIESSLSQVNKKLEKHETLKSKVTEFDKELKRKWLYVEDNSKSTNEKLDKFDDRVDGL